jgi:DNA-binding NarL/FixJ family response regulator
MDNIKILLIDDHTMFRSGLRMLLLDSLPELEIIEAGTLNQALLVAADEPDAVLLDIKLPGLNGVDGIALIKRKWPQVPVLMLSSQDEPETVRMALAHGATCFISKADTADNIVTLLQTILRGEVTALLQQAMTGSDVPAMQMRMTPRQCEVLDLLCKGMSNKSIARELQLSENTIRGHVQALFGFLQVSSRLEAVSEARSRGLIS